MKYYVTATNIGLVNAVSVDRSVSGNSVQVEIPEETAKEFNEVWCRFIELQIKIANLKGEK